MFEKVKIFLKKVLTQNTCSYIIILQTEHVFYLLYLNITFLTIQEFFIENVI